MNPQRILLAGATGTIGRATAAELAARGHAVVPFGRADLATLARDGLPGRFDAVVSCMASRSGAPRDAWAVDHAAHCALLRAAVAAGLPRWVQLSAICVQKPILAFQQAKLAFEAELRAAPLAWSIVRPTAFFKSLSGQLGRVQAGKPFLVFGDGRLTACKPISDPDLARFLADVLEDPASHGRILPVGGPGPAITPMDQAAILSDLLGRPVPVRRVPVALMGAIIGVLSTGGIFSARARDKAELARIGRYYATESMLVWDAAAGRYDAAATPETGTDRLADHYAALLRGEGSDDRGAHAVF
jgi:divinyl chlorophyllide a 8-vinyl-reductase